MMGARKGGGSVFSIMIAQAVCTSRKNAHIDMKIALNQSKEDYEKGVMRWQTIFHRHKKVYNFLEAVVLEQREIANVNLDSKVRKTN